MGGEGERAGVGVLGAVGDQTTDEDSTLEGSLKRRKRNAC